MIKSNKQKKILLSTISIFMLVIILGIAYAAFSQNLNINGTATIRNSSWDIHFDNLQAATLTKTAKELTTPTIQNNTQINDYRVSVTTPGDAISYTFDVVNEGDYSAKITSINLPTPQCSGSDETSNNNVCSKLMYTLKYANGAVVQENDILSSKETKTMVLTLTYQEFDNANLLALSDVEISHLGISIVYSQDSSAFVNNDGTTPYDYPVGKSVTLHGENYYVIKSTPNEDYVTLLKELPLSYDEVNNLGAGHLNNYANTSVRGNASYINGDAGVAYYTSSTCGYLTVGDESSKVTYGCINQYNQSEVKYVVDNWAETTFDNDELKVVDGYSVRLISITDLEQLGYGSITVNKSPNQNVPTWVYNLGSYWTMSNSDVGAIVVNNEGDLLYNITVFWPYLKVRPVINVYKSKLN